MKNYIIKIGLLFFATFLFYSCNDDSLERYPLDEISNETYWNTENDLLVYNNYLYDQIDREVVVPILHGHGEGFSSQTGSFWYLDEMTDNMVTSTSFHDRYSNVRAGIHFVPTNPEWYGYRGWDFLRAVNIGLENYNNADLPQDVIDMYAGEAKLFRGWFFADKVQKFGDVIWIDHELNIDSEELYAKRTPRDEVMQNVLADLDFACSSLPALWGDGNSPGRVNRWCALLVKSRVCLYEGTWQKYHGGSNASMWLQEAADAATEIMEDGPYSLYVTGDPDHDYNAYHRVLNLVGNPEVMYWRRYEAGLNTNNVLGYWTGFNGGATKNMIEDYLCTDGLPISLSPLYQGDATIEDVFENRDPRLRQTILHPADQAYYNYGETTPLVYPRLLGMTGVGYNSITGYHFIKVYNADDIIGHAYAMGEAPAIILRFGEVLLNYAEAKAELGTISQADLDMSINALRDRVGMIHLDMNNVPVDPRYVNDGVSELISEIRRERRVELIMEGFRYSDLIRWKQGKKLEIPSWGMRWDDDQKALYDSAGEATVGSVVDPVSGYTYIDAYQGSDWAVPVFDEGKHYLWPIPLSAISQNPNLGQNLGW